MKSQNNIENLIPPSAPEVEMAVLGVLIVSMDSFFQIHDILNSECFYVTENRIVYNAISNLITSGKAVDLPLLTRELINHNGIEDIGGVGYLTKLTSRASLATNIEHHAKILHDFYLKRKLIEITQKRNFESFDLTTDVADTISRLQDDVVGLLQNGKDNIHSIADGVKDIETRIEQNQHPNQLSGIGTGLSKFDHFTGGLQKSDLIIIAGESSQGKTSLALTMVKNAAMKYNAKIAFYSLEMSKAQLTARIIAQETGIPGKKILNKYLPDSEIMRINNCITDISKLSIYFDEKATNSIDHICNSIRKLKLKFGINLVVVDYLQLIANHSKNKTEEGQIAEIARKLKNIAKEQDISVIALSQLSRDKFNPEPKKNRLRGSGQIEEAADIVMLIWRPEEYELEYFRPPFKNITTKGKAEVKIDKGRNIGTGSFLLTFNPETTGFYDYEPRQEHTPTYNPDGFIESEKELNIIY